MTRAGEKVLTTILAAVCVVLFVLALAMQFGLGRGYHWLAPDDGSRTDNTVAGAIDRQPFQLPPQGEFAVIAERPLFNEDRKPAPEEPVETANAPPPSPLNISLTGTLLAANSGTRVAMVRENGKAQTIALKEGMPLPGDQGAWTLTQVKNRSAIFKSNAGEEVEVELAVGSAGQKPGAPPRPGGAPANRPAASPQESPVAAQNEDLQRRIEERRKQMREAAERMKSQHPAEPQQHR